MIYTLTLNPAIDRELRVPEIVFDDVLRATAQRVDFGGKGFNVSRALAALGQESVALGFIGGFTGRMISTGLTKLGVGTDFVEIAGETRTNVSIVSEKHHIKVNEAGPTVSPAEQARLMERIRALARADDWWVLSGSLPPGVSETIYAEVIQIVQTAGARVLLDTSGPALKHGCAAGPFLVKPNAAEASELTGRSITSPDDAHGLMKAIHQVGPRNVLISLGKRGAVLSDGQQCWLAKPPTIQERNPIGAGDSMVAGLVWGLNNALPLPAALRWGVASGAATASLDGTAVGAYAMVKELTGAVELAPVAGEREPERKVV